MAEASRFRRDVLERRQARKIVRNALFPYIFQAATLLVFLVLVLNGFRSAASVTGTPDFYLIFRKTNLSTLVVWGLWWPGLILATILLGRLWCTVCPMELVSNLSWRLARRVGLRGISLPSWVRAGYLILGSYIVLQLLVAGFDAHRVPVLTARVLTGILVVAVLVGAIFREPRAFCSGFCPAALLLDAYGRIFNLRVGARRKSVCDRCRTKDCMKEENLARWNARSCPSLLRVDEPRLGQACVECFQCAKVCPHRNVGFGLLATQAKSKMMDPLGMATALFVFIASGFVAHELFSEVKPMDRVFHAVPRWLTDAANLPGAFPWFEALWFLAILPLCVIGVFWVVLRVTRRQTRLPDFISQSAYSIIPVVAAGHAAKAILKMNSWSGYLPGALRDPVGLQRAVSIASGELLGSQPLFPTAVVAGTACALLVIATSLVMIRWIRAVPGNARSPSYVAGSLLFALYFSVTFSLLAR